MPLAVLPLVEPEAVVPLGDVVDEVDEPLGEVAPVEEVEPDVPIDAPAADEPWWALVSVQLSSDPWRQPVTVTVDALVDGLLAVELLVPEVPLVVPLVVPWDPLVVPCEPLVVSCEPLCAATLTANAQANATLVAVPNTRFMLFLL